MRKQLKVILPLMMMLLFISCTEINKKVDEHLNVLINKANSLDTLINKEIDKVMALDSLINLESIKVKALDSLINKSTSKIDSIAKEKIKSLK
ncbi:MAG: hypothetical protein AB9846_14225 [Tenuifilaceae bacterium]